MNNSKKVKDHFDALSPSYRENFVLKKSGKNYEFRTRLNLVKNILDETHGFLYDCACGTGEITASVLEHGNFNKAVVSDISNEMLISAKNLISKSDNIIFKKIDVFKYEPPTDIKFDVILCLGLIAHTGKLEDLIIHLKSMLSPNGIILLQSSLAEHWGVKFVRFVGEKSYRRKHGYDINYYTTSDIERVVESSRLKIIKLKKYCFYFPYGDKLFGIGNYWLEKYFEKFSSRKGSEGIFVLQSREENSSK